MSQGLMRLSEAAVRDWFGVDRWPEACDRIRDGFLPGELEGMRAHLEAQSGDPMTVVVDRREPWIFAIAGLEKHNYRCVVKRSGAWDGGDITVEEAS